MIRFALLMHDIEIINHAISAAESMGDPQFGNGAPAADAQISIM